MLYREIIAVCSQIHTKHINTLCGQNVEFLNINPLKAELNPICHLLALLGAHHILHISGLRVKVVVDIASTGLRTANYSEIPVTWEKLLLLVTKYEFHAVSSFCCKETSAPDINPYRTNVENRVSS